MATAVAPIVSDREWNAHVLAQLANGKLTQEQALAQLTVVQIGRLTPLLIGVPGCGKTRTIEAFARAVARHLHTLIGGIQQAGDIGGYLCGLRQECLPARADRTEWGRRHGCRGDDRNDGKGTPCHFGDYGWLYPVAPKTCWPAGSGLPDASPDCRARAEVDRNCGSQPGGVTKHELPD
jgi:hypothetical protein